MRMVQFTTFVISIRNLAPLQVIFCTLVIFIYHIFKKRWAKTMTTQSLLMICYGPFIFSSIGVYGFMDIVPAALICIGAVFFYSERYGRTGIVLAIAAAAKFYPALLVAPVCVALITRGKHRACRSLLFYFGLTLTIMFGCALG